MVTTQLANLRAVHALQSHPVPPRLSVAIHTTTVPVPERRPDYVSTSDWEAAQQMVESRRREFVAGRRCATQALAGLGCVDRTVTRQADRSPSWPPGTTGSISHSHGLCWAAAGQSTDYRAVGIDIEQIRDLSSDVQSVILTARDLHHAQELRARVGDYPWELIMFSAKESTYKVWQPLTGRWLGYQDAHVEVFPDACQFEVSILDRPPPDLAILSGSYSHFDHFVCTSIAPNA